LRFAGVSKTIPSVERSIRRRRQERAGGSVRNRIGLSAFWAGLILSAAAAYQIYEGWSSQRNALAELERQRLLRVAAEPRSDLPDLPALPVRSSFSSYSAGFPSFPVIQLQPVRPMPRPLVGDVIGRLRIPGANIDLAVFEGVSDDVLRRGPGHVPGTGLPTGSSNCVIAAHRDSFFRPLRKVKVGDRLFLTGETGEEREYRLAHSKIVSPQQVSVMAPTPTDQVTLVTCYPFDYIGPAPYRMVWQALPVSSEARLDERPTAENSP
jgi:LPXTG-site transpeptidase (sortase) family protein